ncbi:MAG: response regulator transcription factor [Chloroflexi bacterium]|nr:response regulator transcription factor [Chloroflexota bacterium]
MEKIKILLADASALFRQGMRWSLSQDGDMDVVHEADEGEDALSVIDAMMPDVAVVESQLPLQGGIELTRRIRLRSPKTAVIMLATHEDEEQLFQAIKAGAAAYYRKEDVTGPQLINAIRRVYKGEYIINESLLTKPQVASRVLRQFQDLTLAEKEVESLLAPLSPREVQVLEYVAQGNSNKGIARALGISDQTVKNHITSIMRKLAANDRTHAVVLALRHGYIKVEKS